VGSVPLKDKSGADVGKADVIAITPVPATKKLSTHSIQRDVLSCRRSASPNVNLAEVLKSIPYEGPLDRTLRWILYQDLAGEGGKVNVMEASVNNRCNGYKVNYPFLDNQEEGIEEYETSISRCESDRGTHGRGSPLLDWDQSRLQDIYTQLLIRQAGARVFLSQNNRRVLRQGEDENSADAGRLLSHVYKKFGLPPTIHPQPASNGLPDVIEQSATRYTRRSGVFQAPAIDNLLEENDETGAIPVSIGTFDAHIPRPSHEAAVAVGATLPELRTREKRPKRLASSHSIKIGRTFSSKKAATLNLSTPYACEWKKCNERFTSTRDLFMHVEDHVCTPGPRSLLGQDGFRCSWRTCPLADQSKQFSARYQLLYHLQNVHCAEKIHRISIQENEAPVTQHNKQDGQFIPPPLDDRTPVLPKIEMGVQSPKGTSRSRRNSLYRSVHQKALCRAGAHYVEVPSTPDSGSVKRGDGWPQKSKRHHGGKLAGKASFDMKIN
jgi:hypothetical protein